MKKSYRSARFEETKGLVGDYSWEQHETEAQAIEAAKRKSSSFHSSPGVNAWGEAFLELEAGEIVSIFSTNDLSVSEMNK